MVRITIDDCVDKIENQFDLTLLAAKRAVQISDGSQARVETKRDKPVVTALREIAEGKTNAKIVQEEEKLILDANRTIDEIRAESHNRHDKPMI